MEAKQISLQVKRGGVIEIVGRFLKNASDKIFSLSKPNSALYLNVSSADTFFDGEDGGLVMNFKVGEHIKNEVRKNPDFLPKVVSSTDIPFLFERMQDREREQYGKSFADMSIDELLANEEFVRELFTEAPTMRELACARI